MTKNYAVITRSLAWAWYEYLKQYFEKNGWIFKENKNPLFVTYNKVWENTLFESSFTFPTPPYPTQWESFDLETQLIYLNHWIDTNRRIYQTSEDVVISIDTTIKRLLPIQAYQDGDNIIVLCVNTAHPKLSHALIMSEYNPDWKLYEGNFFIALQAKNILEKP